MNNNIIIKIINYIKKKNYFGMHKKNMDINKFVKT